MDGDSNKPDDLGEDFPMENHVSSRSEGAGTINAALYMDDDETARPPTNTTDVFDIDSHQQQRNRNRRSHGRSKFEIPNFDGDRCQFFIWILAGIVNVGLASACVIIFILMILYDSNYNMKPFKAACFLPEDMSENICFFSAGQVSKGLISLGQVNIGLICIGQVNIGLLFAFGQVALGIGYSPIGQLVCGWYVNYAQVGFGLYNCEYAQLGLRFLKCCDTSEPEEVSPIVTCNGC